MGAVALHVPPHAARSRTAATRSRHVGRVESGSPATGSATIHDQELADLLDEAFAGL